MQAWILNKYACLLEVRQLSNGTLNLYDVDFYIWMKNTPPKEDTSVFKQQFWHIFMVPDWFNTLTNAEFHKDSSMNGCMRLCALKKCPPLKHGIKQSKLAHWLREKAGLTSELTKQVVEPFTEWHVEYTCKGIAWNKAARQAHEKCKARSVTTEKVVIPHPEKMPTFLNRLTDKSTQPDNNMIVNETASVTAEPKTWPLTPVNTKAILLYADKDDIEFST